MLGPGAGMLVPVAQQEALKLAEAGFGDVAREALLRLDRKESLCVWHRVYK